MTEIKIKTRVGEIVIPFQNIDDLKEKIKDLDVEIIERIVNEKFSRNIVSVPLFYSAKEFKDICIFTSDGLPKLIKYPEQKTDIIKLVLFLSNRPLNLSQITQLTGVSNPLAYMSKNHFIQLKDGTYILEADQRKYVSEVLIPCLKKSVKGNERMDQRSS